MANKFANAQNKSQENDDSLESLREDKDFPGEANYAISGPNSERLIRWVNPQQALVLSLKNSQLGINNVNKDSIFKATQGLEYRIPKQAVSLDEKYLRRCLELIHFRASKMAARCNGPEKIRAFSENSSPSEARSGDGFDSAGLVFECPAAGETGSVVVGPAGHWILGSITGSKSMKNIMKSTLFHQLGGALDSKGVDGSIQFDFVESPSASLSLSSSPMRLGKGTPIRDVLGYDLGDNALKKRMSLSSTNSACSEDQASSTGSGTIGQAMLQCTWRSGVPHFVFSTDDQRDVFVANLWKVDSRDKKALDYVYLFHSGKSGSKDHEICDGQSLLVGKMKASNLFTIETNGSKAMETEFVLFGGNGGRVGETPSSSSHCPRKHKGLPRKVIEVFRSNKTMSKFSGPRAIQEDCSLDSPGLDTGENPDRGPTFADDHPPPSLELAAILVRDHIVRDDTQTEHEPGGWGLKFLKKVGVKQTSGSTERSRNNGDCSTSMDVLIPAGLHGGPRKRIGGPLSLTERWKSGGQCDCGGWDIGCPLTVLKPKPSQDETHTQEEFKSFDFTTQGSDHGAPPKLRLVNVQDDLYFVHFQRTLSILQSFSIAVAVIHSRSPTLRPRYVPELK